MTACADCGSSSIVDDRQQGHAVCRDCGAVVESSFIVSELQFEETSGGGIRALGTRIGAGGVTRVGGIQGSSTADERRRQLLHRARDEIRRIASSLNFSEDAISQASNFYDQALNRKLTLGVRWAKTLSACIYIVARLGNMPVMLLDLSDIVQVNVWELGHVYNKICRGLFLTIPVQDPSLLIMRFSQKLELGDQCQKVMNTAVRICQRMNRDWMHIGRRPAGLCGSALLAACRFHGFNRSFSEFAELVCISTSTLKLRLKEFADTPAGKMCVADFLVADDKDIVDEHLPPISKQHKRIEEQSIDEELIDRTKEFQLQLEKVIEQRQLEVALRFANSVENDEVMKRFELSTEEMEILTDQITSASMGILDENGEYHQEPERQGLDNGALAPQPCEDRVEDYVVPETAPNDTFSDIDDDEIDQYLLREDEVVRKTKKWVEENMQYLREFRDKSKGVHGADGHLGVEKSVTKKRKSPQKRNPQKLLDDALTRKSSGKINYDILANLERNFDIPTATSPPSKKLRLKDELAKREMKEDLMRIHSIVKTMKDSVQEMKVDFEELIEEDVEEVELEEEDDPHMSASQMMSEEMGYDYGRAEDDE